MVQHSKVGLRGDWLWGARGLGQGRAGASSASLGRWRLSLGKLGCVLIGTFLVAGCAPNESTSTQGVPEAVQNPVKWEPIEAGLLEAADEARRDQGFAARDALAAALIDKLTRVIMSSGPETAIAVCRDEAPKLAAGISQERGVRIGRTSFRLRNPKNSAPEWARSWIESRTEEPRFAKSDQGDLAILAPIRLKRECLMCHGAVDQLAPTVIERLASLYPDDQATGFAEGDLRGWFWIEVPEDLPSPASE